ncbi:DUF3179 domain-containing protein [Rapidithrix thailandica]|uniref:DUF3179 domain-containing protein n=1 Tax=Rapidithrix thailandica TaxID=413964 RepID=A0AAW9SC74_9BACT
MRYLLLSWFTFFVFLFSVNAQKPIKKMNGFELSNLRIPQTSILRGGPPKDGIPALHYPPFVKASEARFLTEEDYVIGVEIQGIAKAYPIRILNWHEVVNDFFAEKAVVITFCPLCGSGAVFASDIRQKKRTFGVSGLLYNSDVLLYDQETQSLWSQLKEEAISGTSSGQQLTLLPSLQVTWKEWKQQHPNTLVLSIQTGYQRDYNSSPYTNYKDSEQLWFPVPHTNKTFPNKEKVLGIRVNDKYKAYPFSELKKIKQKLIEDEFQGQKLRLHFNRQTQTVTIRNSEGDIYPSITLYWFAWYAFHPDTEIYHINEE